MNKPLRFLPLKSLIPNTEYARMIGVTTRTLWNYEASGILTPAKRIRGRKYRDPNELPRFDAAVPMDMPVATAEGANPRKAGEASPCDGCRFHARCAAEKLACERFSMFSHGEGRSRWMNAPTAPTAGRYAALFD